jgi:hypothetical protein
VKSRFRMFGAVYHYLDHPANSTITNERAVEIPVVSALFDDLKHGSRVLEVGDVLAQYGVKWGRDIVDLGSMRGGVQRVDVNEFKGGPYDLIVSVSTVEHVGIDDGKKDVLLAIKAIDRLCGMLAKGGQIFFTVPVGFNRALDAWLDHGWQGKTWYMIRVMGMPPVWVETDRKLAKKALYGSPYKSGNVVTFCSWIKK